MLVDAVVFAACTPLHFDEWGLDVCIASSQRDCSSTGNHGLGVSDRALAAARRSLSRNVLRLLEYKKRAETASSPFTQSIHITSSLAKHSTRFCGRRPCRAVGRHQQMRDLTLERTVEYAIRLRR